ncbi:DUF6519 domain-containing protein [uncultured Rhodoblastus sp.]|uniref:DUF6519 domain-containing protein n=1 Tax=uncultured Rhodoblastus sp. TaxID=543037 RepID=UPI0025FD6064|nr:DUF6519 domain-containing protein [uncultured Rhodoblastus sp.]
MKGDFSRNTFRPERRFRSVLQQQGRVGVDADANEQAEIFNRREDETTRDVVGPAGRPNGQFTVTVDGGNLKIGAGTLYLDGVPCANDAPCTLTSQPFLPLAPGAPLANFPDLADGAGAYAVYLRVFERIVTAVEDPAMREKALGGADTGARAQMVWQMRLRKIAQPAAGASCATIGDAWKAPFNPGALTASTVAPPADDNPCVLPPQADYRGLENQLYRVEIHRGGPRASATFKWSRENGSVLTAVVKRNSGDTQTAGPILSVASTGRDADIGFGAEQFVELLDDRIELTGAAQPLSRTKDVRAAANEIELHAAAALAAQFANAARLRRWDQQTGDENGAPVASAAPIQLEHGVAVSFAEGDYRAGDYWLIPARTAIDEETGAIEWPTDGLGNFLPQPSRFKMRECLLTVMQWNGSAFAATPGFGQCVPEFPPLTAIPATEVYYASACADLAGARTVAEALDALCERDGGACTVVVRPGPGWEAPILALPAGADAEICFPVGDFPTPAGGVTIQRLGHLKLTGGGLGTRIRNPAGEIGVAFIGCADVIVRDLAVIASQTNAPQINGALTFLDCGAVDLDGVYLETGDNAQREAACLAVRPAARGDNVKTTASLRVRGCTLIAGERQYGILGVNILRAQIEDNQILCNRPEINVDIAAVQKDAIAIAGIGKLISARPRALKAGEVPAKSETSVQIGATTIAFSADPRVRAGMKQFLSTKLANAPRPQDIVKEIGVQTKAALADPKRWSEISGLIDVARTFQKRAIVGLRGVCLAGNVLREARIVGNTITRFRDAVHIGLSHREASKGAPDVAESVLIQNNRIETELVPGDEALASVRPRGPRAVFVGNVANLLVLENHALVRGVTPDLRAQVCIEAFGALGPRILVRGNRIEGFRTGASLRLAGGAPLPSSRLWLMAENVLTQASVVADGPFNPPASTMWNIVTN